jgi:hypothetical protein
MAARTALRLAGTAACPVLALAMWIALPEAPPSQLRSVARVKRVVLPDPARTSYQPAVSFGSASPDQRTRLEVAVHRFTGASLPLPAVIPGETRQSLLAFEFLTGKTAPRLAEWIAASGQ